MTAFEREHEVTLKTRLPKSTADAFARLARSRNRSTAGELRELVNVALSSVNRTPRPKRKDGPK